MRRRRKRGENGGAWEGAGEREAMRRRVGREYEMRAGERQLRLDMTSAAVRQGSFDFEWGSLLCAPVRSGVMRWQAHRPRGVTS